MFPPAASLQPALVMDRGGVFLQPRSPFWMIRFRFKGRKIRESSGTRSKREALSFLRRRMSEFGLGRGGPSPATLGAAAEALLGHIAASRKSGESEVRSHLKAILAHFGGATFLPEVTSERMEAFIAARRSAGLRDSSVHNEMSTLRRCLRLQWKRQRLLSLPHFPMPANGKARQGFFTAEEVDRLCRFLPAHAVNAVRFAWETGWRRGEIFGLRWEDVDFRTGIILLSASKNGEPRQLPFKDSDILMRILREQRARASSLELRRRMHVTHVFHYAGRPLPEGLKRSWAAACRKAGLESRIFHDLRRSFIQRCEDRGVPRSSAMKITGHRTEAIYARYAITPRASISAALKKLASSAQESGFLESAKPKGPARLR